MTSLKKLQLAGNRLADIHHGSLRKNLALELLNLANNNISTIPNDVKFLHNLQWLNLSSNNITYFYHFEFTRLKKLHTLNNNKLSELLIIFDPLAKLTSLHLESNRLQTMYDTTFQSMTVLKNLLLDFNRLTSLPLYLFASNTQLRYLSLTNYKLTVLFSQTFEPLVELESLFVEGNYIIEIPKDLFAFLTNLNHLTMHNNAISLISDEDMFSATLDLMDINLCCNGLKSLPENVFGSLSTLNYFNLTYNR